MLARQVERGVDELEVRERLREVSEQSLRRRVVLLRDEPELGPHREQPLEQRVRLVVLAEQLEAVDEPERARQEDPLAGGQPVDALLAAVAEDEAVIDEVAADRVDRAAHARVARGEKADERNHEQARVERVRAVVLRERAEALVVAVTDHVRRDLVAHATPAVGVSLETLLLHRAHGAVERDPGHHLRVDEVALLAADLPDAVVGLAPARRATLPPPRGSRPTRAQAGSASRRAPSNSDSPSCARRRGARGATSSARRRSRRSART